MKRVLIFCVVVGLFAGQASATMYTMDAATAKDMRLLSWSTGDGATLEYVGYNPGGASDWVYGSKTEYGAGEGNMYYAVGFTGDLDDNDPLAYSTGDPFTDVGANSAIATIGLQKPGGASVGLSGTWDDFLLPISNDNDDVWKYQAYVAYPDGSGGTTTDYSGWSAGLAPNTQTTLLVLTPSMDYSIVTGIGFQIRWDRSLNNGRVGDDYNTSVVPVPAAVLLGILGLGVVGLKLRKYA